MTHADTAELNLHPEAPAPPSTLNGRPRLLTWIVTVAAAVALVLAGYSIARLDQIAAAEERRADRATTTAEQLCQQVRALGATCVVDPAQLPKGERGATGPAGPPPSDAQIRAAIDAYFVSHPPLAGRAPTAAEIAIAVVDYLTKHPPGPTDGQIARVVQAYLIEHPPPAGATGATGPAGPPCPAGMHQAQAFAKDDKGRWIPIVVCVRD